MGGYSKLTKLRVSVLDETRETLHEHSLLL